MTTLNKLKIDSAIALAAITAFLYCASTAYYGGYLAVLKLDVDVLDRNLQQTLYHGFITFISYKTIAYLLLLAPVVGFFYYFLPQTFNEWIIKNPEVRRKFLRVRYRLVGGGEEEENDRRRKQRSVATAVASYGFIALIFLLAGFEQKGKEKAHALLQRLDDNVINTTEIITVKIGDKPIQLMYLTCGERNCAGIEPNTRFVYYFPQNGHSFMLAEGVTRLPAQFSTTTTAPSTTTTVR